MSYIFKSSSLHPASSYNPTQTSPSADRNCSPSEQIFQAIEDKDVEKLKSLLGSVDVLCLESDANGNSVLLAAIKSSNVESMLAVIHVLPPEYLLDSIQKIDYKTESPLHAATQSPDMFIALLECLDFTPLDARAELIGVTKFFSKDILFQVLKSPEMVTAIFDFVPRDQHQTLISDKLTYGNTLLHEALGINAHGVPIMLFEAMPPHQLANLAASTDASQRTVFLASIQSGNMEAVMKIIHALPQDKFCDLVLKPDCYGRTPLQAATRSPAIFMTLLKQLEFLTPEQRLFTIKQSEHLSRNLLWYSVNSIDMVLALLKFIPENQRAALVLENPCQKGTALHQAVYHRAYDSARALIAVVPAIQREALAAEVCPFAAHTTLDVAIKNDLFDIVAMLLDLPEHQSAALAESGKPYNQPQFYLAMQSAVKIGTSDMVARLLGFVPQGQQAAYIQHAHEHGYTLLHLASAENRGFLLNFLPESERPACARKIELDLAVDRSNLDAVTGLLNSIPSDMRTAIIQKTDSNGHTLLHRALGKQPPHSEEFPSRTHFDLIKLLLRHDAKVDAKAVDFAMAFRSHSVFRFLLDPTTTELMHAEKARREQLLHQKDASLLAPFDSRGWNALMYAMDRGDEDASSHFIGIGADRNSAIFLLNSYRLSLDEKLKKLFEIQHQVKDTKSANPIVKNMMIIYRLSLEEGLNTANNRRPPDEMLISRIGKGLAIIDEIMPEEKTN